MDLGRGSLAWVWRGGAWHGCGEEELGICMGRSRARGTGMGTGVGGRGRQQDYGHGCAHSHRLMHGWKEPGFDAWMEGTR
eukprot:154180-Chlamydomonas_euryale.AAC.1